jgi:hypothetical protein
MIVECKKMCDEAIERVVLSLLKVTVAFTDEFEYLTPRSAEEVMEVVKYLERIDEEVGYDKKLQQTIQFGGWTNPDVTNGDCDNYQRSHTIDTTNPWRCPDHCVGHLLAMP